MPKFIITTGTPGSGKSSILSQLKQVKIVSLADELLNVAKKTHGLTDRDKLRYLSDEDIVKIRHAAIEKLNDSKEDVIIDTHASVKRRSRYVPGITLEGLGSLNKVHAIIYIDATPEDILARREADKTRTREQETAGEIDEQRIVNISLISAFAFNLGIPIYIINNKQNHLAESVEEARSIVKEVLGV